LSLKKDFKGVLMAKSFEDRDGWIWMNGNFIPWKNATSHIVSQGLHYASAVFEGERAYNGKIFKSEEHTKRFFKSAEIIGIKIPYSEDELNFAKKELIKKMNYKDCYVRPLAWRGGDQMGISTTQSNINVAIAVWDDWASYFKIEDRKAGLKLITSPWKRPAPDTAPYEAKASGPYIICTMSKEFAESKGYHDALMLDYRGYVAEGTGANIFFYKR
jgi:branched-chain amino acid aminotransferase